MCIVARSGGTLLGNGDRVNHAADSVAVAIEHSHEIVVIASAVGSTTDDLLDEVKLEADDRDRTEVVSMGERISARTFKTALAVRGVNALFIEPGTDEWPVIMNDLGEVDVKATREQTAKLAAELGDVVPVITGFLAQNHDSEIAMLGHGGSDTSAVMLGSYTDADEVVIMTSVGGVMTGDPHVIGGAHNVGRITVDELRSPSFRGTEVIVPSALSYRNAALDVRVARYQHGDLLTGGTLIEGRFHNLIDMQEEPLACLTVVGRAIRNRPGILADLSATLREKDISVNSVASGMDPITSYILEDDSDRAEVVLCDRVVADDALPSVTVEDGTAVVRVTGGELPNRPGIILDIVKPLSEVGINIRDAITPATSVVIFVAQDDRGETLGIVQDEF